VQDQILAIRKAQEHAEKERELANAAARGAHEALSELAKKAREEREEARVVAKIAREQLAIKLSVGGLLLAVLTGVVFHLLHI